MLEALKDFHLAFLPLFVALDSLGNLPLFTALTSSMSKAQRRRVSHIAIVTGLAVGLAFLGLGRGVFAVLGISLADFLIAGGIVIMVLALRDMVASKPQAPEAPDELIAVVPIGTPLLVGPASISVLLVLSGLYPAWLVVVAFLANMLLAWAIFLQSGLFVRVLGTGGLHAFSKVMYLLLAAIAVQLITRGIAQKLGVQLG